MDTQSFYTRHMLLQYGRQLISSRRLARYHQLLGRTTAVGDGSPTGEATRALMIERITREVVDNLIFSGSENPVVLEVRQRLDEALGEKLIFQYPPGELDFHILRAGPSGPVELSADEKHQIMGKLWDITKQTVSETIL